MSFFFVGRPQKLIVMYVLGVYLAVNALLLPIMGQQTDINPQNCVYSFTVPKTDISSTCSSYSAQQVALLKERIDLLQKQVAFLTKSGGNKGNYMSPNFHCNCDSNTTFAFTFRGKVSQTSLVPLVQ